MNIVYPPNRVSILSYLACILFYRVSIISHRACTLLYRAFILSYRAWMLPYRLSCKINNVAGTVHVLPLFKIHLKDILSINLNNVVFLFWNFNKKKLYFALSLILFLFLFQYHIMINLDMFFGIEDFPFV